jgi:PadR family transcriptional regulator
MEARAMALLKGTLDVLVLKTLSWGPMHGFEVTTWLEERSGGHLEIDDSALYQALHRLEERGLVTAAWGVTENNRRARYYSLTSAGKARLREEGAELTRFAQVVTAILAARSA